MKRLSSVASVLLCLASIGCGAGTTDPDDRVADWEENSNRVKKATAADQHQEAIAVAEAFLKKHPDSSDGHLMLGDALVSAAESASDHRRPAWFTEATAHFVRTLEISKNPLRRATAASALVTVYGPQALSNETEVERYARLQIDITPRDPSSYMVLIAMLIEQKRADDLLVTLAAARKNIEPSADNIARYCRFVLSVVTFIPNYPKEKAAALLPLLPDAVALADQSLAKYGRDDQLINARGLLLREQAAYETDPARQRALSEESKKMFDEFDRLHK